MGQSLCEKEVKAFERTVVLVARAEVIGVDKRMPLGTKEWSRPALRKEMV